MPDIRLATLTRLASTAGTTIVAYLSTGKPVGIDPAVLYPTPAQIGAATTLDLNNSLGLKQNINQKGLANGYASLDATGKIPSAQIPAGTGGGASLSDVTPAALGTPAPGQLGAASRGDHIHPLPSPADIGAAPVTHTHGIAGITGLQIALDAKLNAALLGAINGIATLGADGKVPVTQLPAGLSQAALDAKADAAATTTALNTKAATTYVDSQLALKLNANDTRVANAIQPDYLNVPTLFSTAYTAAQADNNKTKRCASVSDVSVTLPALAVGTTIKFTQGAAGRITFLAGSGQTIESAGNVVLTNGKGSNVIAHCQATNTWNISGNLV